MTCQLEAKPDPTIKWFRDTQSITDGGRYTIKLEKDAKTPDNFIATLQIKVSARSLCLLYVILCVCVCVFDRYICQ